MHVKVPTDYTENPHFSIATGLSQKLSHIPERDDKATSAGMKGKGEIGVEQDRGGSVMPQLGSSFKAGDRSPSSQRDPQPHHPQKFLKESTQAQPQRSAGSRHQPWDGVGTWPNVSMVRAMNGASLPPMTEVQHHPLQINQRLLAPSSTSHWPSRIGASSEFHKAYHHSRA